MKKSLKSKFYFNFRSPYSWIASRQLFEKFPEAKRVELIPVWEPGKEIEQHVLNRGGKHVFQSMSDEKHRYILMDIRRIVQKLNYQIKWPIDDNPCWDLPHLLYIKADNMGLGMPFFWAIYDARWEQGRDICQMDTLIDICNQLDQPGLLQQMEKDEHVIKKAVEYLYNSYRDDIFGVPYFMLGRERFWGIDRLNLFIEYFNKKLDSNSYDNIRDLNVVYDIDHAGGCG